MKNFVFQLIMEQNKILSIIIPTYNMEKYLRKCLDSLIVSDENMERLEVLVINDGSKDSSSAIGHEYESKYPQTFRVIDKENGNYGSCINRGLKEATGKYVKVLDADDYYDNKVLDSFVSYLNSVESDMVLTDYYQINENNQITKEYKFDLSPDSTFTITDICTKEIIGRLAHQDITFRTCILKDMDYHQTEGISYTDNEWVFKPLVKVSRITYFPHKLYYYLRGREGQTFDPKVLSKSYGQREVVMRSLLNYYTALDKDIPSGTVSFLFHRLMRRLTGFYFYHLGFSGTDDSNKSLIAFDEYVKLINVEVYDALASHKWRLGMRYIKYWRDSNYNMQILPLKMLRWKNKLKG